MTRKIADCRDMPSESGCTLTLTGEEDEVLAAACQHAVAAHGHADGAELREGIRAGLRDAPVVAGPGSFVQIIEFRTDRVEEFDGAVEEWMREIGPARTALCDLLGADGAGPGTYVEVVGFPDHVSAMANSEHPATAAIAKRMQELSDGAPAFRDLDVVRARTP